MYYLIENLLIFNDNIKNETKHNEMSTSITKYITTRRIAVNHLFIIVYICL